MSGAEALDAFRAHARGELRRLELLLACRRRLGVLPDAGRAREAGITWSGDVVDPEFKKNLRIFHRLVAGAIGIAEREGLDATLGPLEERVGELAELVALPADVPLTLKVLLARRFDLERLLVEVGDEEYLRGRAAELHSEGAGTAVTWARLAEAGHLPAVPPLLDDGGGADALAHTRRQVGWVLAAKETEDLPLRARRELKLQALHVVLPVIVVATVLFALAIALVDEGGEEYLLAAAAAAAGAALGGLFRLRDEVNFGAQIREFVPFYVGEVVVGAAAGLLAYVVVRAGILQVGGGANGLAALAFVLGFSEAAFLGLVGRVGETLLGTAKEDE